MRRKTRLHAMADVSGAHRGLVGARQLGELLRGGGAFLGLRHLQHPPAVGFHVRRLRSLRRHGAASCSSPAQQVTAAHQTFSGGAARACSCCVAPALGDMGGAAWCSIHAEQGVAGQYGSKGGGGLGFKAREEGGGAPVRGACAPAPPPAPAAGRPEPGSCPAAWRSPP